MNRSFWYFKKQCCGAGAGGAKIIWDLEPEPKINLNKHFQEDARTKKS